MWERGCAVEDGPEGQSRWDLRTELSWSTHRGPVGCHQEQEPSPSVRSRLDATLKLCVQSGSGSMSVAAVLFLNMHSFTRP